MMKKVFVSVVVLGAVLLLGRGVLWAHFGMAIPSDNMVMADEAKKIKVVFSFSHPFEMQGMDLERPLEISVVVNGKKEALNQELIQTKVMRHKAWEVTYRLKRPGVYQFYMIPRPYWEPAEDKYIVHYTKTIVAAFGDEEGWAEPVGLRTEIVPLSRPFGLYSGNLFQGVVLLDGKPVPYAEVEVEYYNQDGRAEAPSDYMVTQVIKADANGVFSYAVPRPGWWGFAALNTAPERLKHKGEEKEVELGAVIWVYFNPWTEKKK